jgi:hypothetical protein
VPGLAAAGVDDAPPRVAALEAERELAFLIAVEDDPALDQLVDGARRLFRQDLDG